MIMNREIEMEVKISADRYTIMQGVSRQKKEFRFAEMYYLLKGIDAARWQAKEVKLSLEWLADMGLIKRKIVKEKPGQSWLFYQPCFDDAFLHSRIRLKISGKRSETRVYICKGMIEKLRYKYACMRERHNRASWDLPYNSPCVIAEMDASVLMTPEEKQILLKKMEELD